MSSDSFKNAVNISLYALQKLLFLTVLKEPDDIATIPPIAAVRSLPPVDRSV
jgi:hypothetical protein